MGNCFNRPQDDNISILSESGSTEENRDRSMLSDSLSESRPPLFYETPRVHVSSSNEPLNMSEEEQVKMAKRLGLIHHLPCEVFDGASKTRECVICMIDFTVGDRIRYLPCMHTYHTECIDDWLIRSFTCPSCLEPVDAALLSTYETT